jgi:hypothetical protein
VITGALLGESVCPPVVVGGAMIVAAASSPGGRRPAHEVVIGAS